MTLDDFSPYSLSAPLRSSMSTLSEKQTVKWRLDLTSRLANQNMFFLEAMLKL